MDVTRILDPLNDAQREAVTAPPGHALVLAGAGSGKTRVLVHRIAWLLDTGQCTPHGVIAVTFTNKAAGEMRGRIESMLGRPVGGMWVGTFHGLAHRLLRAHYHDAGLPEGFQILDSDDQLRAVRRTIGALGLDDAQWQTKVVQRFINECKDKGQRPAHVDDRGDQQRAQEIAIYTAYQDGCEQSGLVDFAELLLRAHELLRDHPVLLAHYRQRFQHILVDEFQDTNTIQYAWLRLLAGDTGWLFMVGDDDQSIYGWRGARIENIQQFSRDYQGVTTYRLEQNYRSTGHILGAANGLIARNDGRLGKNLWTSGGGGEPIQLYAAFNDLDEARYVAGQIRAWMDGGGAASEVAVLYRVTAQSRVLDDELRASGIPCRIYGGLSFYQRAEVKDALAYLRLVSNRDDDAGFERVVNTPARGIGARTLDTLRQSARARGVSLWSSALGLLAEGGLASRAASAVKAFIALIDALGEEIADVTLAEQVQAAMERSGLLEHYRNDRSDRAQTKVENLEELVNAAGDFLQRLDGDESPLAAFLAHSALEAGEHQAGEQEDHVRLMTLHAAKGLEFPIVYLCGLEEGLFPHQRSVDEPGRLEEERRLCYVGMTRARELLCLSYAESRRLHGSDDFRAPSRFLREIPSEHIREVRLRGTVARPAYAPPLDEPDGEFGLGQRVAHPKFGEGIVLRYEGKGAHARVQVNFEAEGSKWLVLSYANLQVL